MTSTRDAGDGAKRGQPAEQRVAAPSVAKRGATVAGAAAVAGSRGSWLGKAAAKVPTKWLTAAVVGLFLAGTAAFGGLETAEASPRELVAGETHVGPMVSMAIERAVLIDTFVEGGASADAEDGERVLVLVVDAENVSTRAFGTLTATFGQAVRLERLPDQPLDGGARFDDATLGAWLQPGVPAELALSWVVPGDLLADGDEVRIALFDHELRVGQSVTHGEYWTEPQLAATVTVEVEDVGAGADVEEQP